MITKLIVGDDIKVHDYIEKLGKEGLFLDFTKGYIGEYAIDILEKDALDIFNTLYKRDLDDLISGLSVAEQNVCFLLDGILSCTVVVNNIELGMNPAKHQQWVQLFMDFCESKGVTTLYMTTCSDVICTMFYKEDVIRL